MTEQRKSIVLFQGDSITDCGRSREENGMNPLGSGYPSVIAARLSRELGGGSPVFVNRGISGNRVSDLYARWNEDAISVGSSLLSILIGVNDAWRIMNRLPTGATDRFERAYRHLLDETREVMPDTGLVLCEPFILNVGAPAENWSGWSGKLESYQAIVRELAERYGAVFVPLQEPFNQAAARKGAAYWLYDGVHPTAEGHELIADEWLKAVQGSKLAIRQPENF